MSGLRRWQEAEDVHLVNGTYNDEVCDNLLHLCSRLVKLLVRNPPLRVTQAEGGTLLNTQLELHVCPREAEAAYSHGVGLHTGMTPTAAKSRVLT